VGTTIGGDKKEKFSSIDSAKAAFVKIYEARDHLCLFAFLMHARTCRVVCTVRGLVMGGERGAECLVCGRAGKDGEFVGAPRSVCQEARQVRLSPTHTQHTRHAHLFLCACACASHTCAVVHSLITTIARFYPIEIDYSGDDTDELAIKQKAQELRRNKSKLDKRIQARVPTRHDTTNDTTNDTTRPRG
jgi:hypothetical protein